MTALCAVGYVLSLLCVLAGAALTLRNLRPKERLTFGHLADASKLAGLLNPGVRLGVALLITGAVLNTAASIGSLYLP